MNCTVNTDSLASVPILLISIIGIIINIFNIYIFDQTRTSRGSFGILWSARCFCNAVILLTYAFYTAPVITCNIDIFPVPLNMIICSIISIPYIAIQVLQVLLAGHLVIACFSVNGYMIYCSPTATYIQIGVAVLSGVANEGTRVILGCFWTYNVEFLYWESNCSEHIDMWSSTVPVVISISFLVVFHSLTFVKVIRIKMNSQTISNQLRDTTTKNIRLLIQSLWQDSFFLIDIFCQNFVSEIYEDKWWYYWTLTLIWQLSHFCDGCVTFLFNEDAKKKLRQFFRGPNSRNAVVRASGTFETNFTRTHH